MNKDTNTIENVLSKYWECNTTQEEEDRLRNYFLHTKEIPGHLQKYKALFLYQQEEKELTLSPHFEKELMAKIRPLQSTRYNIPRLLKFAACFTLLFGLSFWIFQNKRIARNKTDKDSYAIIEDTRETVMNALCLISDNMQKGFDHLSLNTSEINSSDYKMKKDCSADIADARKTVMDALCLISDHMKAGETLMDKELKHLDNIIIKDSVQTK